MAPRNMQTALSVGPIALANPVLLAPMSGVTDAPFRRLAASLGAGLVISEMTACAALAGEGRAAQQRMARRRVEDHGAGLHVVQIAGCEAKWMAEGARIASATLWGRPKLGHTGVRLADGTLIAWRHGEWSVPSGRKIELRNIEAG